jgi:hypothetical protein
MAQVIVGGDDVFKALIGGMPQQRTIDFIKNQFNNNSRILNQAEQQFYSQAQASVQQAIESNAMNLAHAAARKLKYGWDPEAIRVLTEVGELQFAPVKMQPYLMANPVVRKLYHAGKIEGYTDSYVDHHSQDVGETHYHYRRVMDGIVTEEVNEAGEESYSYTLYMDDLEEDDSELLPEQQFDILTTWEIQNQLIKDQSEDFTSIYGSEIHK